ncbi:MAG TPA: hypothetical protein VM869_30130 [Enhygromyxa sp.]|nr:hypothetical protein [Enhygromyxa sp.]
MAANKTLNLWMASTVTERDGLGSDDGLAVGDFCLVDGGNLYTAIAVVASASTWRPLAGIPTTGPYALAAKNTSDSTDYTCYAMSAVTFRAVLDAPPSTVTLSAAPDLNWPTTPTVITATETGFVIMGGSALVAAGTRAHQYGTYTVNY